jgi:hypothetical protein
MIYTHVLQQGGQGVPSPLDDLEADVGGGETAGQDERGPRSPTSPRRGEGVD